MSERKPIRSLAEVVGENVAALRHERARTQQDLANAMRELGYHWLRSTVAAIEAGRREPSIGELVGLCSVLNAPIGDLVGRTYQPRVRLSAGTVTGSSTVRSVLDRGGWFRPERVMNQLFRAEYPGLDEALLKAARALGVERDWVSVAAHDLWGRSIVNEREARLGDVAGLPPRTVQGRRGHVTRALIAELRDHLEAADGEGAR